MLPAELFCKICFLSFESVSDTWNWKFKISDYFSSFVRGLRSCSKCKSLKEIDECKMFFKYFISQPDFVSNRCIDEHIIFYGWKSIFDELDYQVESSVSMTKIDFPINIYGNIKDNKWEKKDYIKMKTEDLKINIIEDQSIQPENGDDITQIDRIIPLLENLRSDPYNKNIDVIRTNIIKIKGFFSTYSTEFLKKYFSNLEMYGYEYLDEIRKCHES